MRHQLVRKGAINEIGNRYCRLLVIAGPCSRAGVLWLCRCDCGKLRRVAGIHLRYGLALRCSRYCILYERTEAQLKSDARWLASVRRNCVVESPRSWGVGIDDYIAGNPGMNYNVIVQPPFTDLDWRAKVYDMQSDG